MIAAINTWVCLGLALFYFGPVNWPASGSPNVAMYVGLCLLAFNLGFRVRTGIMKVWAVPDRVLDGHRARGVLFIHAVLALTVTFLVTGRSALDVSAYSSNFGQVYTDYGAALATRQVSGVDQVITVLRASIFPFALIAFVSRFRTDVLASILFLGPMIISSLFRGTDKELTDVALLLLVALWLHGLLGKKALPFLAVVPVLAGLFLTRRLQRFDGELPLCLPRAGVCFDYGSWLSENFGPSYEVLAKFVTHYLTNGYQGLDYAFRLSWSPNWGLGHLPPVSRVICDTAGFCAESSYQESLTQAGWDASAQWTSVYPILANDLSFWLVPLYLLFLGWLARRALESWRSERSATSGATLFLVVMFWFYSSINMQVGISLEWAFATVILFYASPLLAKPVRQEIPVGT